MILKSGVAADWHGYLTDRATIETLNTTDDDRNGKPKKARSTCNPLLFKFGITSVTG